METLGNILQWISVVVLLLAAPITLWQIVVALRGLFPMVKRPVLEDRKYRFAVIICARNEEAVIGSLIDSLMQQDYPRDCFRVIVVADNCTDATAQEARRCGAVVYERFNHQKVGKGYALHWAFEHIKKDFPDQFDAVAIFDADNLAAPAFLTKINEALCSGADMAQGYRDTKNVGDSSVSTCYAIYWMMLTRFYHRARNNWGMSCVVGGTGFAFKMECLDGGWNTSSLVEDSEFSIQQVRAGRHIQLVYDAVVYDEQPVTWGMSIRQRFRWIVGCVQCMKIETPKCLRALFRGCWGALDMIMYMFSMVGLALLTVAGICAVASFVLAPPPADALAFKWEVWNILASTVGSWVGISLFGLLTVLLERRPLKQYWKGVLVYPVFIVPMAWLGLMALIYPKTEWKPIVHTKNQSIADMVKPG